MARISRKCYEFGYFHIMVQGIEKRFIFSENSLKLAYMKFIEEASKKYEVQIIAYCIMDNHSHYLVYSNDINNVSKVMASTNTRYAKLFNYTMNRCGYVFRDRYRCQNIYTGDYLRHCINYIHNNPVVAGICDSPEKYQFSSYNLYIKKLISEDIIKMIYGKDIDYLKYIKETSENMDFLEIDNEFGKQRNEKPNDVLKRFENINVKDEKNIAILANELLKCCNITTKDVANLLNIQRTKLYRIMKKMNK